MGFHKKTVKDVALKGKTALVSVDYNVPGDEKGAVTDNYRITCSLPTIEYLLKQDCKVVLISHRGRPEGKVVAALSLEPVARELQKLLKTDVLFAKNCVGPEAETAKKKLKNGQVLLLENTRFHSEEEANDAEFAKQLASGTDVFVQDAFGNAHRKHASTDAVTHCVPAVAGLLLEAEVTAISNAMERPERPLMAIIGGAKIADKLKVLNRFIDTADFVAVGGAMANTFLYAEGIEVGKSLFDKNEVELAKDIIEHAQKEAKKRQFVFYLPQDGVVANKIDTQTHTRIVDWNAHVVADIENYPKLPPKKASLVAENERILDIGPFSGAFIAGGIQMVKTVIWNGPLGITETDGAHGPIGPFAHGTETVMEAMMGEFGNRPYTLVGGGDTAGYIEERDLVRCFDHVSTGGGASLDLMSGKKLPAVEALEDKK